MSIDKAVKINGFKYRSWKQKDGTWTDPLANHNLPGYEFSISTTILPEGAKVLKYNEEADMITEIKKAKYLFKASDLSKETKQKFRDEGKAFEDDQGEDEQ